MLNQILFDEQDRDLVVRYTLDTNKAGYVRCYVPAPERGGWRNRIGSYLYLHRLIGERINGSPLVRLDNVDHQNGNKLDLRRSNLRVVNHQVNQQNRTKANRNNTSGLRGVYFRKDTQKWQAQHMKDGKHISLGSYLNKEDAERAVIEYRSKHMPGAKEYLRTD